MTSEEAPWQRGATEGDGSPCAHAKAPSDGGPAYNTLTYEADAVRERDSAPHGDFGPSTNKG